MFIFFILIFGSFIHTEMIVINYCDLQKNTKLFLDEIEQKDIDSIKNFRLDRRSLNDLDQSFTSTNSAHSTHSVFDEYENEEANKNEMEEKY